MTPDPTPACEQDAATIAYLHERIDRLETERGENPLIAELAQAEAERAGERLELLRAQALALRQRALDAEGKVAEIDREVEKCRRLIQAGLLTDEEAFHVVYNRARKAANATDGSAHGDEGERPAERRTDPTAGTHEIRPTP